MVFSIIAFSASSIFPAYADPKSWDDLQEKALSCYQAKKFDEAVATQKLALQDAKETFGPEHRNVAESLDNLSVYTQALGDNAEADRLYQRALAILEKALQPDDPYLAIFMDYLSDFYKKIGKTDTAKELRARARAIRDKR